MITYPNNSKLIECVPNISEGKNKLIIDKIVSSLDVEGAKVLNVDSSQSANRTVVTFLVEEKVAVKVCTNFILQALSLIDMKVHHGIHPRIGAVDVFPLIPYKNISIYETVLISHSIAEAVYKKVDLPIFYYEYSSFTHTPLQHIRQGEYEGLEEKLKTLKPDLGSCFNTKTGAMIIGARDPLIAYNVTLDRCSNIDPVKHIASLLRASGTKQLTGWVKDLKAIAWYQNDLGHYQVSCNIIDYKKTPLFLVYESVKQLASLSGIEVKGSEIIGLVPYQAMEDVYRYYTQDYLTTCKSTILQVASKLLALDPSFDIKSRIIYF